MYNVNNYNRCGGCKRFADCRQYIDIDIDSKAPKSCYVDKNEKPKNININLVVFKIMLTVISLMLSAIGGCTLDSMVENGMFWVPVLFIFVPIVTILLMWRGRR